MPFSCYSEAGSLTALTLKAADLLGIDAGEFVRPGKLRSAAG